MTNLKDNISDEHEEYLKIIKELKACSAGHGSIEITTVDINDINNTDNKRE